jgi:microcin C transport system substrate-binding protein
MIITRRRLIQFAAAIPAASSIKLSPARAQEKQFRHALTLFSDIKYPPDFKHFDYVNPGAPKGGRIRLSAVGSFDSLNPYSYKGDAANAVSNETLLTSSLDEPSTEYGLVAEGVWFPEDFSQVVYRLRPEAKFHDGKAMTPEDVIWSMTALKEINPQYNGYYKNVAKVEQTGDHEVTFHFSEKGNRELPLITGQLPVLPKHWWTGKDANGKDRNIGETTLEVPLGSGPYRASDVKPGASITLKRVEDYWGKDLPVNIGTDNFDEIETIFFKDANVALEAFKGDQYDYRYETSAKAWATGYDFPAIKDKRAVKELVQLKKVSGMQSFAFNTRLPKFQDKRVRLAFNFAFDFEFSNANLFYGQYTRSRSYFNNSDMEAKGLPSPEELKLLEPLKDKIPPEVFTTEYVNPINNGRQDVRKNLRAASQLLAAAGWNVTQDGGRSVLKNAKGERLDVTFTLDSPLFERIVLPYKQNLELLGVGVTVRTVDSAQYQRQVQTFDFEIIVMSWGQSLSPGNEQRYFWGSEAADRNGSQNVVGIKDPAIDHLIEEIVFAKDRDTLTIACRALDRVLMWSQFVVPMWYSGKERISYWNRFGKPDKNPEYALGVPSTWWWDAEQAKKASG